MTIHMKDFGKYLITRQAAKGILNSIEIHDIPVLDFSGVKVANHPFIDELAKGIAAQLPVGSLNSLIVENSNSYIDNCIVAGFATASLVG